MSIRNAAKAIIERDGSILLTKCRTKSNGEFYELPGGGQRKYETMEKAVLRECLEETGHTVTIERFLAVHEEIMTDENLRKRFPNYTHRIFHIFLCHVTDDPPIEPPETDLRQVGVEWIPIEKIEQITLRPPAIQPVLKDLLKDRQARYLGTSIIAPK